MENYIKLKEEDYINFINCDLNAVKEMVKDELNIQVADGIRMANVVCKELLADLPVVKRIEISEPTPLREIKNGVKVKVNKKEAELIERLLYHFKFGLWNGSEMHYKYYDSILVEDGNILVDFNAFDEKYQSEEGIKKFIASKATLINNLDLHDKFGQPAKMKDHTEDLASCLNGNLNRTFGDIQKVIEGLRK